MTKIEAHEKYFEQKVPVVLATVLNLIKQGYFNADRMYLYSENE
jgi:hypothetical protein